MSVLRAIGRRLLALFLLLVRRDTRRRNVSGEPVEDAAAEPRVRDITPRPRAELVVFVLLMAAAALAAGFSVLYVVHDNTQLLGLALGISLVLLGWAAIVAGKQVVPQETAVEERPELVRPQEEKTVDVIVDKGDEGISRRGLLLAGAGAAGTAVGAALVIPAASLGPKVGDKITRTPWRRGRRLVDQQGRPLSADQIEPRALFTAFPEDASRRDIGAAVVLVKLPPEELELPAGREGWAPEGIVAFSKICTHAGCAVSLYRTPLSEPTSHEPALVCPCHYSTFDVRRAAKVIFGPAGRPLPQLPLTIDGERNLVAAGGFSGPVGPAWLSVRRS